MIYYHTLGLSKSHLFLGQGYLFKQHTSMNKDKVNGVTLGFAQWHIKTDRSRFIYSNTIPLKHRWRGSGTRCRMTPSKQSIILAASSRAAAVCQRLSSLTHDLKQCKCASPRTAGKTWKMMVQVSAACPATGPRTQALPWRVIILKLLGGKLCICAYSHK